jgi:hypothetical protein
VAPHPPSPGRPSFWVLSLALAWAVPANAQEQVGPARCVSCHSSLAKTSWEQKHRGTAKQLDQPKAAAFAAATGGNPKAARCVACHAPTTAGADKGVSCETCHGAGSLYRVPHQQPSFYQKPESEWLGLVNLYGQPDRIAKACVGCHVLDPDQDGALAAAGHPTGVEYAALGRKLDAMKHWPSNDLDALLSRRRGYDAAFLARVTGAAQGGVTARVARLPKPARPVAAASPKTTTVPAPPKATPEADPFFADEVPEYVPGTIDTAAPRRIPRTIAAEPPPAAIAPAPLAPEPAATPAPAAPKAGAAASRPPAADAAELRGRALLAARLLLRDGVVARGVPPPAPSASWSGPDGELLRLQDEALALAMDTLRQE